MLEKVMKKKKQTKQNKKFFFNQLVVDSHFSPEFIMLKEFLIAKKKGFTGSFLCYFQDMSESCDRGAVCSEMFARPSQVAFRGMNYTLIYIMISIVLLNPINNSIICNNLIILFR